MHQQKKKHKSFPFRSDEDTLISELFDDMSRDTFKKLIAMLTRPEGFDAKKVSCYEYDLNHMSIYNSVK